uniref:hypothetical protein n=1 Tax=Actinoplanes sp. CA-151224 TaxID=3239904 RepID=UPI003F496E90
MPLLRRRVPPQQRQRRINGIRHSVQRVHTALTASPDAGAAPAIAMQDEIERTGASRP